MRLYIIKACLLTLAALMLVSCATTHEQATEAPPAMQQSANGHVAFFFTAGMQASENRKAYGEFIYSYEGAKGSLISEGYSYSYHSTLPLNIANGPLTLSLGKKNLSEAAGIVFIKSKGRFRVIYGVYAPELIVKEAIKYFDRRP